MNQFQSNVLIISENEIQFENTETVHRTDLPSSEECKNFKVVFIDTNSDSIETYAGLLRQLSQLESPPYFIFNFKQNMGHILNLLSTGLVFQITKNEPAPNIEKLIIKALYQYSFRQQKIELQKILNERHQNLKSLSSDLEQKVEKREKSIFRSKSRLENINKNIEALNKALIAIHKSNSIGILEDSLNEALEDTLNLEWVRFFFQSHKQIENRIKNTSQYSLFSASIDSSEKSLGQIYFARDKSRPFKKEEIDFLNQISEAVSLAIVRLSKLNQSESLKQQWESTFDSISQPLCLCNLSFEIIKTNRSFSDISGKKIEELSGLNCFNILNIKNASEIVLDKLLQAPIRAQSLLKKSGLTFEIKAQKLNYESNEIILLIFNDITERLKIEKQLIETSKMAELGTIGSSIAHELNNPLGGMLSFLQLIKMDLVESDEVYEDILEMETAAKRCKDIVENLLGFSRKHDTTNAKLIDLKDVLKQSLKITEIQTRSRGINVDIEVPPSPVILKGEFNLLSQALRNLLQNAHESISQKMQDQPRFEGQIKVEIIEDEGQPTILINDNGQGINPEILKKIFNPLYSTKSPTTHSGLGLTLAYKIIDEHNGRLEIFSQPNIGTTAKISF